VVTIIAISLFLVLQLALPISRIVVHDETALRFGWQMFSTAREAPSFVVETENGQIAIDIADYMAGARGDVDILGPMPPHLCEVVPGAIRVTWDGGEREC
jgi:hypothetical protein